MKGDKNEEKNMLFTYILMPITGHSMFGVSPASHQSKYVGQEMTEIRSLSEEDIKGLRTGQGWRLAKAAKFNGFLGPIHLLEMKHEIRLIRTQTERIEELYNQMKERTLPLRKQLIEAERILNKTFSTGEMDKKILGELLDNILRV